jgi:hypothetical protein
MNLRRCHLQLENLDINLFLLAKTSRTRFIVGCNEASNLVECIKREEFEVKCKRKDIENYE